MKKVAETYIILICQYIIYSFALTFSWNEMMKGIEWAHVEWTQVFSFFIFMYLSIVLGRTFYFMLTAPGTNIGSK